MATTESKVVVAPDSTGKAIRNLQVTTLVNDVPTVVQMQVVALANDQGQTIDLDIAHLLEDIAETSRSTAMSLAKLAGGEDGLEGDDANICERGFIPGLWAGSGLPREVNNYNPARMLGDKFGRQVTIPWGPRELYITATPATITDNTSKTLIAADGDVFLDLVAIVINNTSATNTRIDVSDGTNTYAFQTIGGAGPVGISLGGMILPAAKKNTAWTVISSVSVTDIRIFALFLRNK